jgi:hypothetical protein
MCICVTKCRRRTVLKGCRAVVLWAMVVIALALPKIATADWPLDLIDDPNNPIFNPPSGERIYYPSIVYDADGFGNANAGPFYKMWFSDGVTGIGTATSDDGIAWTEGNDCAGLTNAHHADVLYDANGFGGGAAGPFYRMWYWDTANLYNINAIRTAQSNDGINWSNDQALTQDGAMPIISGGAGDWNRGSYGPAHLFYQPGAANAGTNPFDYEYVMYYDGTTGGFEQIGLGYSADGFHWTRYGNDPVLPSGVDWTVPGNWGAPTPWDSSYATFGSVIRDSDGLFHLFYSGGTTASNQGIGYATSDDGINWTKDAGNPYIEIEAGTWHSQRAYTPSVTYDEDRYSGHGDNTRFKLWYCGRDDGGNFQLGYQGTMIGTLTVSKGPNVPNPECLDDGVDYTLPLLQLILDADAVEQIDLESIRDRLDGSALAESVIKAVLIYRDVIPNGEIDPEDVLLLEVTAEGAEINFDALNQEIPPSSSIFLLIAVKFAITTEGTLTVQSRVPDPSNFNGAGVDSGQMIVKFSEDLGGEAYECSICDTNPPTPPPQPLSMQGGCKCRLGNGQTHAIPLLVLHILFWGFVLFGARLALSPSRSLRPPSRRSRGRRSR